MKKFNIRVYGLLIHEDKILLSDELVSGRFITKLPGGGLEFGEGCIDCLKREFVEELGIGINHIQHFYTTDFFQPSAFHPDHQIISVYYTCKSDYSASIATNSTPNFPPNASNSQSFRWIALKDISPDVFTLPIDKVVAKLITLKIETLQSMN